MTKELLTFGTCDALTFDGPDRAVIVDFKMGRGKLHPEALSAQMATYAVGALQGYGLKEIVVYVYQPRTGEIWTKLYTSSQVDEITKELAELIERCKASDAPLSPSPTACQFCKALSICPEVERAVVAASHDKRELTPEIRAQQLEVLALVEDWAERVRKEHRQYMLGGGWIPGWWIQKRQGARYIPDPNKAFQAVCDLVTTDEMLSTMDCKITALEELLANKFVAAGEKTKRGGKLKAQEILAKVVERKPDIECMMREKKGSP